jgi:hypothetical protein
MPFQGLAGLRIRRHRALPCAIAQKAFSLIRFALAQGLFQIMEFLNL